MDMQRETNDLLDNASVSSWLDNHPEFFADYLKKWQIQRRRSSIMTDNIVLSDFSPTNKPHLHSPLSHSSKQSLSTTLEENKLKNSNFLSAGASPSPTPTIIASFHASAPSPSASKSARISNSNIQSLISFPFLFTPNSANLSYSEPSIAPSFFFDSFQDEVDFQPVTDSAAPDHDDSSCSSTSNKTVKQKIYRDKFKNLSLYEKMYTLVKILYQSLDLKRTCKEILNTVSLLLDADRCSLFLVTDEDNNNNSSNNNKQDTYHEEGATTNHKLNQPEKYLISVVFDAKSKDKSLLRSSEDIDDGADSQQTNSNSKNDDSNEQIKIPYGKGIAGYVASTGQPLNIPDAYADARFNDTIDKQTGYRTRNILCLPILNENGECIAVAEAINKFSDDPNKTEVCFTQQDENTFGKFMPFIAIAIRNSNLYAHSRKEAQTNKVLLELATIVFDESSTTVDNLVSRILFNSIFLLECERCQVILLNTNLMVNNSQQPGNNQSRRSSFNDINKYFDRVYELTYQELKMNECFSHEILVDPKKPNFSMNSPELKIMNTVIQTREIFQMQNDAHNEKQYFDIDIEISDLNDTSALLCIPVMNSADQVVALIFACNKMKNATFKFFTKSDINVAQAFALFCGIGIQNIMMYEKVVRAMNMQQVALDVLSYHVSSNQDEVNRLLQEQIPDPHDLGLYTFDFDEGTLDDLGTLKACLSMFGELDLIEKFNIPYEVLCRFFLTVKKNYRPVAYHNWRHGFNVMSAMYLMLTIGNYKSYFNDLEILSLLIACICHDLDHRGTTNNFQIKIQSPLAKLYSTSTMEHHHFNQCIIILHNNMNNILMNLTPSEHSTAIDIIEKAILATDLALHFKHIDKFLEIANSKNPNFGTSEERDILLNILMTACDLSGSAKPWKCHYRLSLLVSSEFFNEGDLEKEKFKQEPIDSMNRNKSDQLPNMQIQFLQSVCVPLYNGLTMCNPLLKRMSDTCDENIKEWLKLIKQQQQQTNK